MKALFFGLFFLLQPMFANAQQVQCFELFIEIELPPELEAISFMNFRDELIAMKIADSMKTWSDTDFTLGYLILRQIAEDRLSIYNLVIPKENFKNNIHQVLFDRSILGEFNSEQNEDHPEEIASELGRDRFVAAIQSVLERMQAILREFAN